MNECYLKSFCKNYTNDKCTNEYKCGNECDPINIQELSFHVRDINTIIRNKIATEYEDTEGSDSITKLLYSNINKQLQDYKVISIMHFFYNKQYNLFKEYFIKIKNLSV